MKRRFIKVDKNNYIEMYKSSGEWVVFVVNAGIEERYFYKDLPTADTMFFEKSQKLKKGALNKKVYEINKQNNEKFWRENCKSII